jgi:hypothetical protein
MSFANLKRNRNSIDKLVSAAQSAGGGEQKSNYKDERMWKPTIDKMGNGYAVVRFLPAAEGQDLPWVRYWDHGFKGPTGKWYIERSLTSIGQEDPVGKLNSKLWNMSDDDKSPTRKQARDQKRRLHHVANVMVVSDPANPENEGKVFMYQFGKKIFDKIMDAMSPQYADETPMNPFDFWEGANFKIKIRKVDGWVNYDKSEFDSPTELYDGDDTRLEGVYNSLHNLGEFTDPAFYKSYAELEAKLNDVLGQDPVLTPQQQVSLGTESPAPSMNQMAAPQTIEEMVSNDTSTDDDEEDTMSYFAKLANG